MSASHSARRGAVEAEALFDAKVLYQSSGNSNSRDQREGRQQGQLVGHVAPGRLQHGRQHAVEQIQPAQQCPAQQHGAAEGRAQQA
jgi:hypothetical protein